MKTYHIGFIAALTALNAVAEELPETDCLIEPYMIVNLGVQEQGVIKQLLVERGDFVTAGQVVATLEAGAEQASFQFAAAAAAVEAEIQARQVNLNFNQLQHQRQKELFVKKVISRNEMDQVMTEASLAKWELFKAKEDKRLASLELNRAKALLARRKLQSPISGAVMERFAAPGESVKDDPVMKIAQLDPLKVEVIMPVAQYGTVLKGMKATVKPESPIGGEYEAKVTIVDPVIDAASGTFGVRLELPNPKHQLPGGLKCSIKFLPEHSESLKTAERL
ncbi:MAG: efflux RND transporter periplasmic adaptor subunit [Methylococcaceae bacterium]